MHTINSLEMSHNFKNKQTNKIKLGKQEKYNVRCDDGKIKKLHL